MITGPQYTAMRALIRAATSGTYPTAANVTDAEVLQFFAQFFFEGRAAGLLRTSRQNFVPASFRAILAATDSDVSDFFVQLQTDAANQVALSTPRYFAIRDQFLRSVQANMPIAGPTELTQDSLASYLAAMPGSVTGFTYVSTSYSGAFSALAVSYGLTMRADFRGDVAPTGATGTGSTNWANTAGDATLWSPGTGATNGIGTITTGINGKGGVASNGVNQNSAYTMATALPGTTSHHVWIIGRFLVANLPASGVLFGDSGLGICAFVTASQVSPASNVQQYHAGLAGSLTTGVIINQWYRMRFSYTGSAADNQRIGAHAPAASSVGNNATAAARAFFSATDGSGRLSMEVARVMHMEGPIANFNNFDADAGPKAQSFWSSAIEIG